MHDSTLARIQPIGLASQLIACVLLLGGCLSERATTSPASEPTWSYRDGPAQLSNNDLWNDMVPEAFFTEASQAKVASAEQGAE